MGNLSPAGTGLPRYRKLKIDTIGAPSFEEEQPAEAVEGDLVG